MQTPSRKYLSARAPDVALSNVLTPDLQNARAGIVPGEGHGLHERQARENAGSRL